MAEGGYYFVGYMLLEESIAELLGLAQEFLLGKENIYSYDQSYESIDDAGNKTGQIGGDQVHQLIHVWNDPGIDHIQDLIGKVIEDLQDFLEHGVFRIQDQKRFKPFPEISDIGGKGIDKAGDASVQGRYADQEQDHQDRQEKDHGNQYGKAPHALSVHCFLLVAHDPDPLLFVDRDHELPLQEIHHRRKDIGQNNAVDNASQDLCQSFYGPHIAAGAENEAVYKKTGQKQAEDRYGPSDLFFIRFMFHTFVPPCSV